MKKICIMLGMFAMGANAFAADPCANVQGEYTGYTAWHTPATASVLYNAQNGSFVLSAKDSNGIQATQVGTCLYGTITYGNYNSVYVGSTDGTHITMKGHLIPDNSQVITTDFTKVN